MVIDLKTLIAILSNGTLIIYPKGNIWDGSIFLNYSHVRLVCCEAKCFHNSSHSDDLQQKNLTSFDKQTSSRNLALLGVEQHQNLL